MAMVTPSIDQPTQDKANTIRERAEQTYNTWRDRGELNVDAIRAGVAKTYVAAKQQMQALQDKSTGDVEKAKATAVTVAFGIDDLAGTDPAQRAAVSMAYRDALDRAEAIDIGDPQTAIDLLDRADSTGDELQARALAQRAWSLGMMGMWRQVVDNYVATRPAADAALGELWTIGTTKPVPMDLFAFVLPAPSELNGLSDFQIDALAAQAT